MKKMFINLNYHIYSNSEINSIQLKLPSLRSLTETEFIKIYETFNGHVTIYQGF